MFVGWAAELPPAARQPAIGPGARRLRASYEAANSGSNNRNTWSGVDALSAKQANSYDVRKKLRERARHEFQNDPWCNGIVRTQANGVIGSGPRLRILHPNRQLVRMYEIAWKKWCKDNFFAQRLLTAKIAKIVDGEAFFVLCNNPNSKNPVQLAFKLIECDQATTPTPEINNPNWVDGIEFDEFGNPTVYHVLNRHPGDPWADWSYKRYAASHVIHWFRQDRPGQLRGVTELCPSLGIYPDLRRYSVATLRGAELSSKLTATLESTLPPDSTVPEAEPWDELEITDGTLTTVPRGYKMSAFDPKQPTATYGQFEERMINRAARPHNMPFAIALGDNSRSNYAASRMDYQTWGVSISLDRNHANDIVLDRMAEAFHEEAIMIPGLLHPETPPRFDLLAHSWGWDGRPHVDPEKEANATTIRLTNGTTTYADELALENEDWQEVFEQIAAERREMARLGLAFAAVPQPIAPNQPIPQPMGI